MSSYKIKVNNEAESKEAQELFFQLRYEKGVCSLGGYPAIIVTTKSWATENYCSTRALGLNNPAHENHKEITLPELRDLVVLKRNDVEDATHIGKSGSQYYLGANSYFWDGMKWDQRDFSNLGHLKPIEKTMKEYLVPNNGGYRVAVQDAGLPIAEDWVAIPEGAECAILVPDNIIYFWKSNLFIGGIREDWVDMGIGYDANWYLSTVDGSKIIWQRATQPEELPFIDDEPKVETASGYQLDVVGQNTYGSRSRENGESDESYRQYLMRFKTNQPKSLNDQYAEIEQVRQAIKVKSGSDSDHAIDAMSFGFMGVSEDTSQAQQQNSSAWDVQIGGDHYKQFQIQPMQFALENKLDAAQQNVIKYIMRHSFKNGKQDLEKAKHYIDLMIEFYYGENKNN